MTAPLEPSLGCRAVRVRRVALAVAGVDRQVRCWLCATCGRRSKQAEDLCVLARGDYRTGFAWSQRPLCRLEPVWPACAGRTELGWVPVEAHCSAQVRVALRQGGPIPGRRRSSKRSPRPKHPRPCGLIRPAHGGPASAEVVRVEPDESSPSTTCRRRRDAHTHGRHCTEGRLLVALAPPTLRMVAVRSRANPRGTRGQLNPPVLGPRRRTQSVNPTRAQSAERTS